MFSSYILLFIGVLQVALQLAAVHAATTLNQDVVMIANQELYNTNPYDWYSGRTYHAKMQQDGNFVLYMGDGNNAVWSTNTWEGSSANPYDLPSPSVYNLVMQSDGNLVLYKYPANRARTPIWSSNTYGRGVQPYRLVLQNDRNLVLYDGRNSALWSSNTWVYCVAGLCYNHGKKEMLTDANLRGSSNSTTAANIPDYPGLADAKPFDSGAN